MAVKFQGGRAIPASGKIVGGQILYDQIIQSLLTSYGPGTALHQIAQRTAYMITGDNAAVLKQMNPRVFRALMLVQEASMAMKDALHQ